MVRRLLKIGYVINVVRAGYVCGVVSLFVLLCYV